MERPKELSGKQGEYIEYLEGLLDKYQSKKTIVGSYFGLKKILTDINLVMKDGILVKDEETQEERRISVISGESLSSGQDKVIDRVFKFIDNLAKYNKQLKEMEQEFAPELKKAEDDYGGDLEEIILSGDD